MGLWQKIKDYLIDDKTIKQQFQDILEAEEYILKLQFQDILEAEEQKPKRTPRKTTKKPKQ